MKDGQSKNEKVGISMVGRIKLLIKALWSSKIGIEVAQESLKGKPVGGCLGSAKRIRFHNPGPTWFPYKTSR